MDLQTVLKALQFYHVHIEGNPMISGIEMDSRKVKDGHLFVCLKGYTVDGHDFAERAVQAGAVAIVAEKELDVKVPTIIVSDSHRALAILSNYYYGQPTKHMRLIGVTGTNGKTTTTHMMEKIFQHYEEKTGLIGTIHIKIGEQTFPVANTTPESVVLQQSFHQMKESGVQTAIMEVSSHALEMGRVHGCDFDIAVFTNLTQDHLDYHKTVDEYRNAKGLLFSQLGNTYSIDNPKFAVLNADDEASAKYARNTAAHVLTYGIDNESDITAVDIHMTSSGTSFVLVTPIGTIKVNMKFVGRFNVYNVLAAASAAIASHIPLKVIKEAIELMSGVPGRFELVDVGQPFSVIVDYSHTPDSLENALQAIKDISKGRIFCVCGCGGDRDRTKRPLMAQIAVNHSNLAIFTSDNPRSEDPKQILLDMEQGVTSNNYKVIVDRREAIQYAISEASEGDVILIAGKGHETYQIIGKDTFDFDDRLVAKEAIRERYE
ncbi:UDP-N-acetylmuramoyl-L-alanyl-D-glutamate--2,6-diaminopimelate ligase [Bacillus solimangrovi]|uniref:UDP-N-acetylmuramoyl-L-alanyl-D-glutamate--2,6-diaminopimelate ligase n=1 Tax=Bacillus solimangrovi TaxID=1305675 RepID=A0A1E5LIN9_9BACI|nr:UDP-N-acetylmuramoyl-L-alanyl-D-glutamate--2,6-diaminopimelate ligase [Bacillus solimangrovi]OEH93947.1 UDP-N-acetylmuramoyl-L-alanyl-D-glutamate--2,6-diaminopimelate ligase [Bacillus solimangrovi]